MTIGFVFVFFPFPVRIEIVHLRQKSLRSVLQIQIVRRHDVLAEGFGVRQAWGWRLALPHRSPVCWGTYTNLSFHNETIGRVCCR